MFENELEPNNSVESLIASFKGNIDFQQSLLIIDEELPIDDMLSLEMMLFGNNLANIQQDLDPEFAKLVDDNFWDLI